MPSREERGVLQAVAVQLSRAASAAAFRWAMASMEIIGFTPEAEGNDELSIT
jgi:hypothetical protein